MKVENKDWNGITQKNTKSKQKIPRIPMFCEMCFVPPNAHLHMERQKTIFINLSL